MASANQTLTLLLEIPIHPAAHLLVPIYTIVIVGVFYFAKLQFCLYIENIYNKYEIQSSENGPNLYFQQYITPISIHNFVSSYKNKNVIHIYMHKYKINDKKSEENNL